MDLYDVRLSDNEFKFSDPKIVKINHSTKEQNHKIVYFDNIWQYVNCSHLIAGGSIQTIIYLLVKLKVESYKQDTAII